MLNHNVETVARLQRAVRPSAGYARSLSVLARAKAAGLVTKSGFMVGLGETDAEIEGLLADLAAIGVDIVTIGQYLRPTSHHIPVDRWVEPQRFDEWAALGESLGHRSRRSQPADTFELPRQVGGRQRGGERSAAPATMSGGE